MKRRGFLCGAGVHLLAVVLITVALSAGCGSRGKTASGGTVLLATTTSAEDSGILDEFSRRFQEKYPYKLKAVAVGSGAALFMGSNGDADIMITHEPVAERDFAAAGNSASQHKLMHNEFLIVGPANDPAEIKGMTDGAEAFRKIAGSGSGFLSRGDASGTNAMEMSLWKKDGIAPAGQPWYVSAGQGMGETLRIADTLQAYTLADRASYTVMKANGLALKPVVEGDPGLLNQYTVSIVNPKKFPKVNNAGALAFDRFLKEKSTTELIRNWGLARYKVHLFYPD